MGNQFGSHPLRIDQGGTIPRLRTVLLFGCSLLLLLLGLVWPTLTVRNFGVFSNTYSIALFIIHLLKEGDYLLFLLVLMFSVLFPLAKILGGLLLTLKSDIPSAQGRVITILLKLGRYSMADVFLVALTVFLMKSGQFAAVSVHFGVYIYALSVLSAALAARDLKALERGLS